ncbi:MAG TPA: 2-amino-4-hydroxy-6-hydroxymethyldihydropteridine diphosphokinase [Methylomirabilota bacterium]|nr:2-amino-4-hydroxy-6-hydroxymethyldihydropteridine diphosphokinase [Methylomirabilota bacterium]
MLSAPHLAFVALGSNLGDPVRQVRAAIDRLADLSTATLLVSSLWESSPVDCPPGSPPFVNAVAGLTPASDDTPERLLTRLQAIERDFGRTTRTRRNEPRPLDLDLIAFGRETRLTPELMLPHPRAHLRRFVLQPLAEIAPDLVLPGQIETISLLLQQLDSREILQRIEP